MLLSEKPQAADVEVSESVDFREREASLQSVAYGILQQLAEESRARVLTRVSGPGTGNRAGAQPE